ncbi:MAG: alpha/beta fold hydrolase [Solirubrobacteraceae bacterium]
MAPPHWTSVDWEPHVRSRLIGGRRLGYLDVGEGPVLVMIHGLGGSWQSWLENLPAIAIGHRVIAVDLPGFGCSDALPPPAAMSEHAATIVALLQRLEIAEAIIVGHSMGGLIALHLAATRPELVSRLVLANAGGVELSRARLAAIARGFIAVNAVFGRQAILQQVARRGRLRRAAMSLFLADPRSLSPRLAAEIIPRMAAPGLAGAVLAASQQIGVTAPPDVRCPVLLIWGAKDRLLPLSLARKLQRDLPDATLVVIEGAGHCPMLEAPEQFNRALLTFAGRSFRRNGR